MDIAQARTSSSGVMDGFFHELLDTLGRITWVVTDPHNRTYWLYTLLTLPLAIVVLWWTRAVETGGRRLDLRHALSTLFARAVWLHPSAITDYWCYVINAILATILKATGLLSGVLTSFFLYAGLLQITGGDPLSLSPVPSLLVIYTLFSLLWIDLGKYVGHRLQHRIPLLWEFHKVHHSAQVLTIMTQFRVHPFDLAVRVVSNDDLKRFEHGHYAG